MNESERSYSVLIVSAPGSVADALQSMFPESGYGPVRVVSDAASARRAAAEGDYDLVFVNAPLPDEPGLRAAADLIGTGGSVVLLLVRTELLDEWDDKASRRGVFTLAKPTSKTALAEALRWMRAARERLRGPEKKTLTLEEKMAEIRIVNRAKWLLIGSRSMDEAQAHRFIEKQAMDRCVTRREIAEELIRTLSGDTDGTADN